jgi:DNA-binding NarL/FixJ family response regulator
MRQRMRILLADQEANVRFGLRTLLERQPGMQVVGEAVNAEAMLSQVKTICPDLVLLDWSLPGIAADQLLPTLRKIYPGLAVIVLSGQPEVRRAALAAGADAFVGKTDPPEQLLAAIRSVKRVEVEECTEKS